MSSTSRLRRSRKPTEPMMKSTAASDQVVLERDHVVSRGDLARLSAGACRRGRWVLDRRPSYCGRLPAASSASTCWPRATAMAPTTATSSSALESSKGNEALREELATDALDGAERRAAGHCGGAVGSRRLRRAARDGRLPAMSQAAAGRGSARSSPRCRGRDVGARAEQHDHEHEEHHDRARVDHDLDGREKLRRRARGTCPAMPTMVREQAHRAADRVLGADRADRPEIADDRAHAEKRDSERSWLAPSGAPGDAPSATCRRVLMCCLELLAELAQEAERRHRRALAEGADGVAHDVVGDLAEPIELLDRRLAFDDACPGCGRASRSPRGRGCTGRTTRGGRSASGCARRATGSALSESTMAQQVPSMVPERAERVDPEGHVEDALAVPGVERALLVRGVDDVVGAEHRAGRAAGDDRERVAARARRRRGRR